MVLHDARRYQLFACDRFGWDDLLRICQLLSVCAQPIGTLKWSYYVGGTIYYSNPAIGTDGTVYVGSYNSKLSAINPNGLSNGVYDGGIDLLLLARNRFGWNHLRRITG